MIDVRGKDVLVIGMGASGCAAAEFLLKHGARVRITDSSSSSQLATAEERLADLSVPVETGGHTKRFCGEPSLVVVSPGVDIRLPEVKAVIPEGVKVIGELELGSLYCPAPMVAVTGTNGKSTTVELIGHILSLSGRDAVVCGNIGVPLVACLGSIKSDSIVVVEVSSFQLETIDNFRPWIAALLNVADDHYDRHDDLEGYKTEKFRIFKNQGSDDHALLPSGLCTDPLAGRIRSSIMRFDEIDIGLDLSGTSLRGDHNRENTACAVAVSRLLNIPEKDIVSGIKSFKTLDHRFESLGLFRGVEYIDDSKATNIDATRRALESMKKKVVLIAGGRDKGGDYRQLLPLIRETVKAVVVIGESRTKIRAAFSGDVPVIEANGMSEAVLLAAGQAAEGEAVLLSPMCSSFDMFSGYRERGEAFRKEVMS